MRRTLNLDDDVYRSVRALAKAEGTSISETVNQLLRRAIAGKSKVMSTSRTGFPISKGRGPFGPEDVARIDFEMS